MANKRKPSRKGSEAKRQGRKRAPARPSGTGGQTLRAKLGQRGADLPTVPPKSGLGARKQLPWSIPGPAIRAMSDAVLGDVMRRLLTSEAVLRGCERPLVSINTEERAGDEGCDAWTPQPRNPGPWLGTTATCWQLKAGSAGQPKRLVGEVKKAIPSKTLREGGRYVVVASDSANGEAGRRARLTVLKKEANGLKLPTANIEVFTSESLSQWLDEHPAIALPLVGMPPGVQSFAQWSEDRRHAGKWVPTAKAQALVEQASKALGPDQQGSSHVHVVGRPGVGKTRLALELCRQAPWRESVLYVPQPDDVPVTQILASLADGVERSLVLVVDEAPGQKLAQWAADAERCGRAVRLLTIGHSAAPCPVSGGEIQVPTLSPDEVTAAVNSWYPAMPREHVEFVVEFADGYVRLARLAADAVAANQAMNVRDLLQSAGVRRFMETLLPGTEDRRALHVLAALTSVGWDGAHAAEGEAIAKHLNQEWAGVRARIQALDDRFGIAPRAGDLRYVSPAPLGVYLAIDAWESYPDLMRSLAAKLPSQKAVSSYYERFRAVMASERARQIAREELERFTSWEQFKTEPDVERWSALSLCDSPRAAQLVLAALRGATHEQRVEIAGAARRSLVSGLVEVAWAEAGFFDAALALAELAEGERGPGVHIATAEFVAKFQVMRGGTACPYVDRLRVVDELLSRGDVAYVRLAVSALAQAANDLESRSGAPPRADSPRELEWVPRTGRERVEAVSEAMRRLERVSVGAVPELKEAISTAARKAAFLIRFPQVRDDTVAFLRAVTLAYPDVREKLSESVAQVVSREERFSKRLSEAELETLRTIEASFQDNTPEGQIRRLVGGRPFEKDAPDLKPCAELLLADPQLLVSLGPWLMSGEARLSWELGQTLGAFEGGQELLPAVLAQASQGRDGRFLAGYLDSLGKVRGAGWVDDTLDRLGEAQPGLAPLLGELTWRCGPSQRGVDRICRLIEADALAPLAVEQLTYGRWAQSLEASVFNKLLRATVKREGYREAALALVYDRATSHGEEWADLKGSALAVLREPKTVRARGDMREYYWTELASKLVKEHPREVLRSLFAAHAAREGESTWFLEHSRARPILDECVEADPAGAWDELRTHLEDPARGALFTIGFPRQLMEGMPHAAVLQWVAEDPHDRALLVANLVPKSLQDGSLGAELLDRYQKVVAGVFLAGWVTGAWIGEASGHWESVAGQLLAVAAASTKARVKAWAQGAAAECRRMAQKDRKREEETRLRGF